MPDQAGLKAKFKVTCRLEPAFVTATSEEAGPLSWHCVFDGEFVQELPVKVLPRFPAALSSASCAAPPGPTEMKQALAAATPETGAGRVESWKTIRADSMAGWPAGLAQAA